MLSRTVVAATAIVAVMAEGVDLTSTSGDKAKEEKVVDPIAPSAKLDTKQAINDLMSKVEKQKTEQKEDDSLLKAL